MLLDIMQTIEQYCTLRNKIVLINMNIYTYDNIYVTDLVAFPKMNSDIFYQKKYSKLRSLDCFNNTHITNLSHLKYSLEKLNCSSTYCSKSIIDRDSIKDLKKLRILDCSGNRNITSVNRFADTLEELYCAGSNISQFGISKLRKLTRFVCSEYIEDVNHLASTLVMLDCTSSTYINQCGISLLCNIKIFKCGSKCIYDLSHIADTLEELSCTSIYCKIG